MALALVPAKTFVELYEIFLDLELFFMRTKVVLGSRTGAEEVATSANGPKNHHNTAKKFCFVHALF
jgi:hypothetical protein